MAGNQNDAKSQDVFDVANWLDRANGRPSAPTPAPRQRRERTDPGRLRRRGTGPTCPSTPSPDASPPARTGTRCVPASSRYAARSSARVAPRLTMTTGVPAFAARLANRNPLITARLDPATSSAPSRLAERVDRLVAPLHPRGRHVLAEEHDVRLQPAAAALARRDPEVVGVLEDHVAVGAHLEVEPLRAEARVERRRAVACSRAAASPHGSRGRPRRRSARAARPSAGRRPARAARRRSG